MSIDTTSQAFFEGKYAARNDPWNFATSDYEQGRYDAILRALSDRRYGVAFEPGCSVGVLTSRLAELCEKLYATDISPTAVRVARERCNRLNQVTISCATLPDGIPEEPLDLIVLSEVGYYLSSAVLRDLGNRLVERLTARGVLVAAHWTGVSPDHVLSGDHVHEVLANLPGLVHDRSERHAGFRIDRWSRA